MAGRNRQESFTDAVYEVVRLVPEGRVTSYGAIARFLGSGQSSRMVGWAMNRAFAYHRKVPAHRVVNRVGMLTGKHHFPTENEMQRRLEEEGIQVKNDQVVDFERVFWDPGKELKVD